VGLVGDTISFKVTLPDLKLFKLTLPQNTLAGEQSETASAMLNVTASEDTQVSLSSDNPLVQVPSTVTVIDGARSGYFPVVAGCVTTPTTATITASYNGGIQTAALALTPETTPPTASIADPGGLARGTKFVTASASDNCGMAGVQFILDGMNLGSQITGSPYTMAWDTTQQTDGPHALVALATDLAGNTATSTVVNYFVDNTPPTLVVPNTQQLWPPDGRTVLVNLNGTASDLGSGVDSITFKVTDSYGLVQPAVAPIDGAGRNSLDWKISIPLEASRNGWDKDGRVYTIEITARDRAGNMKTVAAYVTVPHDQRN
jgi:hypothetical protein